MDSSGGTIKEPLQAHKYNGSRENRDGNEEHRRDAGREAVGAESMRAAN